MACRVLAPEAAALALVVARLVFQLRISQRRQAVGRNELPFPRGEPLHISIPTVIPLRRHPARLVDARRKHALQIRARRRQCLLQIDLPPLLHAHRNQRPPLFHEHAGEPATLPIPRFEQRRRSRILSSCYGLHRHLLGFFRRGLRRIRTLLLLRLFLLDAGRRLRVSLLWGRLRTRFVLRLRLPAKDAQNKSPVAHLRKIRSPQMARPSRLTLPQTPRPSPQPASQGCCPAALPASRRPAKLLSMHSLYNRVAGQSVLSSPSEFIKSLGILNAQERRFKARAARGRAALQRREMRNTTTGFSPRGMPGATDREPHREYHARIPQP